MSAIGASFSIGQAADLGGKTLAQVQQKPDEYLAERSSKERIKQIVTATICAVAFAVFAVLAGLAIAAFAGAFAAVALLTLPAFLPLAIAVIAAISAIALGALAIKNAIDAHLNSPKEAVNPNPPPANATPVQ